MKKIIIASSLMLSGQTFGATLEERVSAVEDKLNGFIDQEKKRNEKINEISNNVLLLQKSLDKNKGSDGQ